MSNRSRARQRRRASRGVGHFTRLQVVEEEPRDPYHEALLGTFALVPHMASARALLEWPKRIERPLYVYVMQSMFEGGPVKIGKAHSPLARMREIQTGNPYQLCVRAVILAGHKTERDLHQHWRPLAHTYGEWFAGGYEEVIVALAQRTCEEQLQALRRGRPLNEIANAIPPAIMCQRRIAEVAS